MYIWEIWVSHFIPFSLPPPQKAEFASHILPLQFLFAISSLIFSLLFTVEKQANRANGKPATPYSSQFRKPSIWKCVHVKKTHQTIKT